ncbi:MAG: transglutaminase-like cysteine peptidase [Devosia sp.]|jgi:predicted transglutaminase-like cysteine proteinase
MKLRNSGALLTTFVASIIAMTMASPANAASMAPVGFQLMCLQHPQECQGGGSSSVNLTDAVLGKIARVNSQVNNSIRPRNDPAGDVWTIGASAGDCEDYVLSKRRALINAGFPPSSLRIGYVKAPQGVDHAILIVKTDVSDLVLDNLAANVIPLQETRYRLLAVSGADPMVWH